jgi:hypothetical protein
METVFGEGINMKCLGSRIAPVATLLALAVMTGCSAPAFVQGVVASEDYVIQDNNPSMRVAAGEMHVVLNEEDGDQLRVLTLEVSDLDAYPLGEEVAFGSDENAPAVTVSQGDLQVIERADGARIVSSENNVFHEVVSGTLTIHDRDELVNGEFTLELADGGHLEGSFSLPRQ